MRDAGHAVGCVLLVLSLLGRLGAVASAVEGDTLFLAYAAMTGRSYGEPLDGPATAVALAKKVLVSHATVSWGHCRDECSRPARVKE